MAVVLGSKPLQDLPAYKDYAIGIVLPIQIGSTAFNQSYTTDEQAKSNLLNLLLTEKGERIMQPEFGSGLQQILFEMNNDDIVDTITNVITFEVSKWLPYITIDTINIQNTNYQRDTNQLTVSVTFKVMNKPNLNTVTFNIGGIQ